MFGAGNLRAVLTDLDDAQLLTAVGRYDEDVASDGLSQWGGG
jgi:hypothetical protein